VAVKTWTNGEIPSISDFNTYGSNHYMKMLYESTQSAQLVWTGSVFTSEFENYFVSVSNASCVTATQTLRCRLTYSGSSANQINTNEYSWGLNYIGSDGGSAFTGGVAQAYCPLGELSIDSTKPSNFQMMVYRPALSSGKAITCRSIGPVGAVTRNYNIAIDINTTTVCDALLFYNNALYTNYATVRVYGMRQT
jgi:hypothetical protein